MKKYFQVLKEISFSYYKETQGFRGPVFSLRIMNLKKGDIVSDGTVNFCLQPSLWPRNVKIEDFKEIQIPFGWGVFRHIDYTKKCGLKAEYMPKVHLAIESPDINSAIMWVSEEIAELINSGNYPNWFIRKNHKLSVQEWMEKWAIQLELEKEEEKIHQAAKEAFFARARSNRK